MIPMAKPMVAVVGRPNVGKSTLFNKIVGSRIAIVEDTPGVTRDRLYADASWCGHDFTLIDTGGIEPKDTDEILSQMRYQAELAIDMAEVIIMMVDVREGMTAADKDVAAMLQKSGKPVILCCNKADSPGAPPMEMYEFYNLGLGDPFPISSIHGMGVGDLLDEVVSYFPEENGEEEEDDSVKIAVVGKPNAGKSSIVNYILGENRVIVSDVAGTTRDAIDSYFTKNDQKYCIIDTAGMRKRGKIDDNVEHYSVVRALAAVDRCNVCLIMIDATEGVTEQDTKIAGYAHDQGKASIIVVNKWDLIEKDTKTVYEFRDAIKEKLAFMTYAPIMYVSAKTGQRVDKIFDCVNEVLEQTNRRVATGVLNDVLGEAVMKVQPPSDKGKRLKVYYMTEVSVAPPTFVVFVNDRDLAHFSYIRYLENQVRTAFGLDKTPINMIVREKGRDE